MTAEVCIMNRLAVVLAADSAATVSQWTGSKYEERYFKGSNKIFQLSDHQPVGLMIFDSADKRPDKNLNTSGLVFAGFGDHEIFPALAEFKSCGLICGKHVSISAEEFSITHEVPAKLASFAQTAMSDTFSLGLSEDVYGSVMATLSEALENFARTVISDSGGDVTKIANFGQVVANARKEMGGAILERARIDHALPFRRVLGVLPVDEMAELAETLIHLQALKEKVTKSSETVGGPVDVAIITKSEGLVWVKRKHFFDIGLNSRYLVRQHNRLTG